MKYKLKKILKMIKCALLYIFYYIYCKIKKINNDDIWLISERGTDARDNGYFFYTYIKEKYKNINVKFVIDRKSVDSKKIDSNDIVQYGSKEHFILFLTAGKLISTHIMGFSPDMSLFWRFDRFNILKLKGKKIFLQHGITSNAVGSLKKENSKLDLITSAAKPEYNYLISNFDYDEKVVKYTGFARYDWLESKEKNQIVIMPTFRKWLNYVENFENTEYFKKWNSLLNNEEFIKYIENENITVYFYPHFEVQKYIKSFNSKSHNIVIADFENYDVQKLLIESKILITDYSSVFFDFAYMKKPVIYYQFDREEFQSKHYQKGYFNFEDNGFGSVCFKEEDVVKSLLNNDFSIYLERNNKFFEIRDKKNCDRIFNEITKL